MNRCWLRVRLRTATAVGLWLAFLFAALPHAVGVRVHAAEPTSKPLRVGVIGLDTSHSVDFTRILNNPNAADELTGCRVVAAYPQGSRGIVSSLETVPRYTKEMKSMGIELVASIDDLLKRVDCVLLESNDGHVHLEQALPVLKANKAVFIDKPLAGSLADVVAIYEAARRYGTPVFTSSALRYSVGAKEIERGVVGKIIGCDAFSPCPLEETHPDFFWYGIHGVETLFTVMGTGCTTVLRVGSDDTDIAVGTWDDGRLGTFRGRRKRNNGYEPGYGGTAFGTRGVRQIGGFSGYEPLLAEVVQFFKTGKPPVSPDETIEIYAFMEAADASKRLGGAPVDLEGVLTEARQQAQERLRAWGVGK